MTVTLQEFNLSRARKDLPDIKPGHIVKVFQKIIETKGSGKKATSKERVQVFEGLVVGKKGEKGINASITVRKISDGIGVERTFPLNTPSIEKIELVKKTKVRRAKLSYMRNRTGKATRLKGEAINGKENTDKIENEENQNQLDENKTEAKNIENEENQEKKEVKPEETEK